MARSPGEWGTADIWTQDWPIPKPTYPYQLGVATGMLSNKYSQNLGAVEPVFSGLTRLMCVG